MDQTLLQKWFIEFDKKHFSKDPQLDRNEQLKKIANELAFPHDDCGTIPIKQIPSERKNGKTQLSIFEPVTIVRPENPIFRYHLLPPLMCANYSCADKMKATLKRVIAMNSSEENKFNSWIRANQNHGNDLEEVMFNSFQSLLFHPGNFLALHAPFFTNEQFLEVVNNPHQLSIDVKQMSLIQDMQVRALNELIQQNTPYTAISRVLTAAHLNEENIKDSLTYLFIPLSEINKPEFEENGPIYALSRCAFGVLTSHVGYFPERSELKTQGFEQLIQEKKLCDEILTGDNIPDVMRYMVREMEHGASLDMSLFEHIKKLEFDYSKALEQVESFPNQSRKIEELEAKVAKLTKDREHYKGENEEMHSMYTDRELELKRTLDEKLKRERQAYRHLEMQVNAMSNNEECFALKLKKIEEENNKLTEELFYLQQDKIIQELPPTYEVNLHPKVHKRTKHPFFQSALEKAREVLARVPFDQESDRYANPIEGHRITIGLIKKYGDEAKIYRPTPHVRIIYEFSGGPVIIKDVLNHAEYERLGKL